MLCIVVLVSKFLPLRDVYTADKGRTREIKLRERDADAYLSRLRAEKLAAASLAVPASVAAFVTTERRQHRRWEGTTGRLRHLAKQKHRAHVHMTHTQNTMEQPYTADMTPCTLAHRHRRTASLFANPVAYLNPLVPQLFF